MSIIVLANPSINEEGIQDRSSRGMWESEPKRSITFFVIALTRRGLHLRHYSGDYCKTVNPICASTAQYGGKVNSKVVLYFFIKKYRLCFFLMLEGSNTECEIPFKLWTKPCIESQGRLQCPMKDFGTLNKVNSEVNKNKTDWYSFLLTRNKSCISQTFIQLNSIFATSSLPQDPPRNPRGSTSSIWFHARHSLWSW